MVVAKTQYYTAMSIDGFIADQGNSPEWPFQAVPSSGKEYRFGRFFTKVGAMAMGPALARGLPGSDRFSPCVIGDGSLLTPECFSWKCWATIIRVLDVKAG
jgi:hypothetical protein